MQNGIVSFNNLRSLGFQGNLAFVHNEEGSGAKFYGSSVYYPDSRKNPKTNSGITVDPGLDLGNAAEKLIKEVLNYYNTSGLLTVDQFKRLITAIGLKKWDAINWLKNNEWAFKKKFLVRDVIALAVLDGYTADDYWMPLAKSMPKLKAIREPYLAEAVHTSLLSGSYNLGYPTMIRISRPFVDICDYSGLAYKIKTLPQSTQALRGRRGREGQLIIDAVLMKEQFRMEIDLSLNPVPLPLMTIPSVRKELTMDYVPVPEKPEIRFS